MRSAAALLLLAACGGTPPAPHSVIAAPPPTQVPATYEPISRDLPAIHGARPPVDLSYLLPDPTHELRWPLTAHPELAPQFAIAHALAEPGLDWTELCQLGAQNRNAGKARRDHVAYLRAWCSAGKRDTDAALAQLAPLTRSLVGGLAPAVRSDLANILVEHGSADDATRLLTRHKITEVAVLDALAATYVELGKLDDAYAINELALARDDRKVVGDRCRRLTRRIVLRPPAPGLKDTDLVTSRLFDVPTGTDETCRRLENQLTCWLNPLDDCRAFFTDQRIVVDQAEALLRVYHLWPERGARNWEWWDLTRQALTARPLPGADQLAVETLINGMRGSACDSEQRNVISEAARVIKVDPAHDPALDLKLANLIAEPSVLCR